ncbi:regulator of G-protein signaling 12 isoform X3 [Xenopus tropicalis]|uniref:Regulator of G-protein signaling 12 isoform X3 n=1 Tax=Xenopus tropicalis TaxID=8364 RepID=A0A8J0SD08_XENTR|nr:regulator of G-protein signaling 12 isoform X3 [Xenopus tropicalis]|eukprot:XP_012811190.1 PREDICTED: regulator of G-protein signaling 12 isoform X3 [Xenopus tropicalis]
MYRPADPMKSRLKMQVSSRLRSVEVARGRTGYGFTLSGQSPCVISSVIKESPAEFVGLKPGDQICAVNEINVKNASHEDVVKLIGKCSGVLHMVIAEVIRHIDSCSSDEELAFYEGKTCLKPRPDSKALGINRAKRVVEEMQSGGIFNMIFEKPSSNAAKGDNHAPKQRSRSMSASHYETRREKANKVDVLSKEEISKVLSNDCLFSNGTDNMEDFELDASILNVGMVVGYLGSIELPSTSSNLEYDSLQAIRGCMRRLRAEQKIHSLVLMKIMHDSIQLCTDKNGAIAVYPAEKLAFSAVCPDDRRFFGLVTMQSPDDQSLAEEEGVLRTSCHVFMVDPELFHHKIHQGISRRFGFECTPDPDTNGCLEFPTSSLPVLQFISVLYRDMGELIEGMRARAFLDNDADAHQNNSTSSNSDSGIGNFNQEEKPNRVLVVDLGSAPSKHNPHALREAAGGRAQSHQAALHWNGYPNEEEGHFSLQGAHADKQQNFKKHLGPSARIEVPVVPTRGPVPPSKKATTLDGGGQRWLPVHVIRDWQHGNISDQESYADSTDGWSSINCGTLPPPMSKIPADRYRVEGNFGQPQPVTRKVESWTKKVFDVHNKFGASHNSARAREDRKSSKPSHLVQAPQRSSGRRSFGRSKRFSITRSLDDLEAATVSDGELNSTDLKGCISENSLSSNASLPSVQSCRRLGERRVASWAVSFERLLQDPVGVRYFTEFLKKEFSEENILFWQSCEYFSRIPIHDKNELSYRAREIFNKFLSSKATTPVNIDSQAHLADDVLNAPHPDMFKEQQLQIFNLMKFDSYTRFLKSHLYQECMLAEVEGRSLPDPQEVPSSPTSKHSISSERSNISTPKKQQLSKKNRSGRSLNEESGGEDDNERKKKGAFFSWSRSKSIGKSQKKRENGEISADCSHINGGNSRRRGSQGSVSSSASLELINCGTNGNALEFESSRVSSLHEKEKVSKQCYISLPDGSSCAMVVKSGLSIKDMLSGLCDKHGFNIAAVDLFLIGGNKPLVLSQDSSILESRDLRIEKRTLFRLDLVPINRSVGLKAKPTKPVTEVLRPVVAKYGLNLTELVARLSGEHEPLDLGLPISNLDGQRVVLEEKENLRGKEKQKAPVLKPSPTVISGPRSPSSAGEDRPLVKSASIRLKRENGKGSRDARLLNKDEPVVRPGRRRQQKINLDEAEAFFEMISKAQSNRAEDQRGLLRKEDLVLPDFLRLTPSESVSSTPAGSNSNNKRPGRRDSGDRAAPSSRAMNGTRQETPPKCTDRPLKSGGLDRRDKPDFLQAGSRKPYVPFNAPLSPIPHVQERNKPGKERHSRDLPLDNIQTIEDENVADLTLVAEGDISSPNSTLLPPPPSPPCDLSKLSEANFSPPPSFMGSQDNSGYQRSGISRF